MLATRCIFLLPVFPASISTADGAETQFGEVGGQATRRRCG